MKFSAISIFLFLFLILSCSIGSLDNDGKDSGKVISAKASTLPVVRLIYGKAVDDYSGSSSSGWFYGYIDLENKAYYKQVSVVYTINSDNNWKEFNASYSASLPGNRERWYFQSPSTGFYNGINFRFYLKYTVNGTTYYDYNTGSPFNYQVGAGIRANNPELTLGTAIVVFNKATASQSGNGCDIMGEIILKNLAYNKTVNVVYSTDNWKTTKTLGAYYGHTFNLTENSEIWYFHTVIPGTQMKFAISYTVNGATYWDNNNGADYTLNLPGKVR